MSGTVTPLPLSDAERVAVREFTGYGLYGPGPGSQSFNRFTVGYQSLEYRMGAMLPAELVIARDHIATCSAAKVAWRGGADNLDTDQAAIWYRNRQEMHDRRAYYRECRRDLARFMGIPVGPELSGEGAMRLVV